MGDNNDFTWEKDDWQVHAGTDDVREDRPFSGATMARMLIPEMFRENQVDMKARLTDTPTQKTMDVSDPYENSERVRRGVNSKFTHVDNKFVKGLKKDSGENRVRSQRTGINLFEPADPIHRQEAFERDQQRTRNIPRDFQHQSTLDCNGFNPIVSTRMPVRMRKDHFNSSVMEDYDYLVTGNISKYMLTDEYRKNAHSGVTGKVKQAPRQTYATETIASNQLAIGIDKFIADEGLLTSKLRREQTGQTDKANGYHFPKSFRNTHEMDMGYLNQSDLNQVRDAYEADMAR